jgi:hypothetical protein
LAISPHAHPLSAHRSPTRRRRRSPTAHLSTAAAAGSEDLGRLPAHRSGVRGASTAVVRPPPQPPPTRTPQWGQRGLEPLALGGPWPLPPAHLVISVTSAVATAPHWSRCIGVRPHASPEPLHRSCCAGARRALLEPLGRSYCRPSTRRQGAIESLGSLCA